MTQKVWAAMAALALSTFAAKADTVNLTGTSVTGAINFNGGVFNEFDSFLGHVPSGYGNSGGSTTVAIGSGVEFGFSANDLDTADFTANTLTITDQCNLSNCAQNASVLYTFTDNAFAGLNLSFVSNDLGLTVTLVGNKLQLSQAVGLPTSGTLSTVISFASPAQTPEPSSLPLLGTGLVGLTGAARRRFAR